MVENLLMTDEEVEEKIDYRPYFTLGDVSLFPVPFTGAEYYLTDRRFLKKGKTIGNRERKDVPLEEIITIDYIRQYANRRIINWRDNCSCWPHFGTDDRLCDWKRYYHKWSSMDVIRSIKPS